VYGVNTLGSIIAVGLASLVLLPMVGLKLLLVLGGGMDMALGVLLLTLATRGSSSARTDSGQEDERVGLLAGSMGLRRRWTGVASAVGASAVVLLALLGVRLDRALLSSGVYRTGRLASPDTEVLFYRDGRTATVTADRKPPGVLALSTNGKPDATLTELWLNPPGDPPIPLSLDEPTQTLLALIALAHNPEARSAVVVGQGSGLSSQMILGSPNIESLVTVEIEPQMLEGSRVFLPATQRVFEDPRSRFVIDDAKSFLAQGGEPLDLILSEPSNPWVSGVSSLFSMEYYQRVRARLAPGGVFGQWLHLYEISDALVLSVLAALHQTFPSYQAYLVHSADMLIVAAVEAEMPAPDWSVFDFPDVAQDLARTHPFTPGLLEASRFMTREGLAPLLDTWPYPNSDFFPILDLGAERTRFLQLPASGVLESASGPFDVTDAFLPAPVPTGSPLITPVPQIPMGRALALRNRIRAGADQTRVAGMGLEEASGSRAPPLDTESDLELRQGLHRRQVSTALLDMRESPADWASWLRQILEGGGWGPSTGWRIIEPSFLREVAVEARRLGAPSGVLAAVSFLQALEDRDWPSLVPASQAVAEEIVRGDRWINPGVVLDAGVLARIFGGDPAGAWEFFGALEPLSGRLPQDFGSRLLRAHLDRAVSDR
jgi:spermidine synthase